MTMASSVKTLQNIKRNMAVMGIAAMGVMTASVANAAIYTLNPEPLTSISTSSASATDINTAKGAVTTTFTDDFLFTLAQGYDATITAQFFEKTPAKNDVITAYDLTLYAVGSSTPIATTGMTSVSTAKGTPSGDNFLDSIPLGVGNYDIRAQVVVPGGDVGKYTVSATASVSAAPEPASWALMIVGVGLAGAMMRSVRRSDALVTAA